MRDKGVQVGVLAMQAGTESPTEWWICQVLLGFPTRFDDVGHMWQADMLDKNMFERNSVKIMDLTDKMGSLVNVFNAD